MQTKKPIAEKPVQRVIKKYPNRRLYDTTTSSYITLSEVKKLVMGREQLVVRDAKSGEDLTRAICGGGHAATVEQLLYSSGAARRSGQRLPPGKPGMPGNSASVCFCICSCICWNRLLDCSR